MELMTNGVQTVEANESLQFQTALSAGSSSIMWRVGSGIITLRGIGPQLRARFRVSYYGNVALSAGAEVAPIEVAILVSGEGISSSRSISTPAAAEEFNNVAASTFIDVPAGCCVNITVGNIGTTSVDFENLNLIVERVA